MALSTRAFAALAAGLLAGATPAAHAGDLEEGNAAFDAGRYGNALQSWSSAERRGDAQAAFDLGLLYDLGDGVPADAVTAFHWYRRAAEAGLGAAALNVGVMYDSGRGAPPDRTKAAVWYARAAILGQARAAFNLGQLYETGEGVPRNIDAAVSWYREAAQAIPEAAVKVAALVSSHRASAHPASHAKSLAAPVPAWPGQGATVSFSGPRPAVQLVWAAPAEPQPVTYFVEVQVRENGRFDEVAASYVTTSAVAVSLPAGDYFAWRVYAVSTDGSRYAPSAWMRFARSGRKQGAGAHLPG